MTAERRQHQHRQARCRRIPRFTPLARCHQVRQDRYKRASLDVEEFVERACRGDIDLVALEVVGYEIPYEIRQVH
jgi:hypothetical protein